MSVPQVHVKMVEHVLIESTHSNAHVLQAGLGIVAKQVSQLNTFNSFSSFIFLLIKNYALRVRIPS